MYILVLPAIIFLSFVFVYRGLKEGLWDQINFKAMPTRNIVFLEIMFIFIINTALSHVHALLSPNKLASYPLLANYWITLM